MSENAHIFDTFIYKDISKDILYVLRGFMFDITYKSFRIEPTLSASRELMKEGKDLNDVLEILEEGYDCSASKRKSNIIEKCLKKGNKEYKAVVAQTEVTYPDNYTEKVWRLIHFGKITYKKQRRRKK